MTSPSKTNSLHVEQLFSELPATGFSFGSVESTPHSNFWFPQGNPPGKSICVASSRLGQQRDGYDSWYDAIRTLAVRLDPQETFFITASGLTTDACVRRIAELFGFVVVDFQPLPDSLTQSWLSSQLEKPSIRLENGHQVLPCFFRTSANNDRRIASKPSTSSSSSSSSSFSSSADALLISIATEVCLLSVRKNGNIHRAVKHRLTHDASRDEHFPEIEKTRLLIDAQLTPTSVQDELLADGAIAWWLYQDVIRISHSLPDDSSNDSLDGTTGCTVDLACAPNFVPILDLSEIQADRFLLHWTRRRAGPWPGQAEHEYLDDLIFQNDRRQHHTVATLGRLLANGRILATNQLTRDSQPVVCFSNLPLTEMIHRKIFRPHLSRWDFQPYGIAIDRELLAQQGARPVIYGDEAVWENLSASDRPFFQPSHSRSGKVDWREEREWRLLDDLNLNRLDIGSVVVFVESVAAAYAIAPVSRWPIVVLGK